MSEIEETAIVEADPRQMDLFIEKDHGEAMTMAEFASWLGENLGGTTVQNALKQAAFMLCCDVIAQDIAKARLHLREYMENGTSRIVLPTEHEAAALLALEPNRRHTWREFVEMMVLWNCFTSNSYAGVLRNRTGDPLELIPFQTGRVRELVEGRDIFYQVNASTQQEQALLGAASMTFSERDMIHVRRRMIDGMDGYSTLTAGKTTLDTAAAIEKYRAHLFGEEGQIRGVFTREGVEPLPEENFQRIRQQFKILMNKFRQLTEPIILEGGVKFETISSKPDEIELTKQFQAQINEVCRLLRVPPHKVFALENVKYENLETLDKAYVSETLIPVAELFEARYSKVLLSRKDRLRYFFQHDRSQMAIRDSKNQTERAVRALERGGITFDEFRAELGWNPLPAGQGKYRMIPGTMAVVDEHGKVIIQPSGKAPEKPETDPEAEPEADGDEAKAKGLRLISSK